MDLPRVVDALLLGIVEGLTEFLPVSSTGHLIIVSDLLGTNDDTGKVFAIAIQLGAILAICFEYRERFARVIGGLASDPAQRRFAANLAVAFVPAAVTGLVFHSRIKAVLFNPVSVAVALVVGAAAIFAIERWYARQGAPRVPTVDDMSWKDALKVGLAQCLALVPGTSRSGATIMGGMVFGL
jgi:undecaprenyl-diphosphatase